MCLDRCHRLQLLILQAQRETHPLSTKKPRPPKDHRKPSGPSSIPVDRPPPEERHAHHATPAHNTKMLISHGPPQDVANLEKQSVKKKAKHHHHTPGGIAVATEAVTTGMGAVAMEAKPKHSKGDRKSHEKKGTLKAKVSARSILVGDKELGTQAKKATSSRRRFSSTLNDSSSDDSDVDVTTPPEDTSTTLSISLKKSLIQLDTLDSSLKKKPVQVDTGNTDHGLRSPLDTGNTVFDTTRHHRLQSPPTKSLVISINKDRLAKPASHHHHKKSKKRKTTPPAPPPITIDHSTLKRQRESFTPPGVVSPCSSETYQVEFDGSDSTKMIFRTGPAEESKKSKKKHKKKAKHAKKKARLESHDSEGRSSGSQEAAGNVWYTDPLKVKIKL